jgi:hypothetical protein
MPSTNFASWTASIHSARAAISEFNGKPFGKSFLVRIAGIAFINQMTQLMNQYIVELKVARGRFSPNQLPDLRFGLFPSASKHLGFNHQGPGWGTVKILVQ